MASRATMKRLEDFALWYAQNVDVEADVPRQIAFLKRALDEQTSILVDIIRDVGELEGRPRDVVGANLVLMPGGPRLRASVRHAGYPGS